MSQYILFYSKKCKYSINFINILHKINARSYFTFISVDRDPNTRQRHTAVSKFQITAVPTIIVNDQVYVGQQSLLWLKKLITEMGMSGPPAISSRNNKESYEASPNKIGHDDENEELIGFDPNGDTMYSIENPTGDARINYQPEDGENHRQDAGDYQINHQSILPNDVARDLDIKLLKEGGTGREQGGEKRQRIGLKTNQLKKKQEESEYQKLCRMRDEEIPQPRKIRNF
jgi:hypothetical protein